MKKITDMSDAEIIALTEDDLEKLEQIELAERGIVLPIFPSMGNVTIVPQRTVSAYQVDALRYMVKSTKAAKDIAAVIEKYKNEFITDSYGQNYSHRYTQDLDDDSAARLAHIEEKKFFTHEEIMRIDALLKKNSEITDTYNQRTREYKNIHSKAVEVRSTIQTTFDTTVAKYEALDRMAAKFLEYLRLCESNVKIAINFMQKGFEMNPEKWEYVQTATGIDVKSYLVPEIGITSDPVNLLDEL